MQSCIACEEIIKHFSFLFFFFVFFSVFFFSLFELSECKWKYIIQFLWAFALGIRYFNYPIESDDRVISLKNFLFSVFFLSSLFSQQSIRGYKEVWMKIDWWFLIGDQSMTNWFGFLCPINGCIRQQNSIIDTLNNTTSIKFIEFFFFCCSSTKIHKDKRNVCSLMPKEMKSEMRESKERNENKKSITNNLKQWSNWTEIPFCQSLSISFHLNLSTCLFDFDSDSGSILYLSSILI